MLEVHSICPPLKSPKPPKQTELLVASLVVKRDLYAIKILPKYMVENYGY